MQKLLLNNKGSALPMVLTVLIIVIIFSVTALTIGSASIKQAENQELRLQAYYLARSGANAVASYIIKKADQSTEAQMNTFISNLLTTGTSEAFKLDPSDKGEIKVSVTRPSDNLLLISSTAAIGSISKTVAVEIFVEKAAGVVLTKAAYSLGNIHINNGTVNGDIFSSSGINFTGGKVNGEVYVSPGASVTVLHNPTSQYFNGTPKVQAATPAFPNVDFPVFPAKPNISNIKDRLTVTSTGEIRNDTYYTNGIFVENGTMTIFKPTKREIYAKEFKVSGSGAVKDDGGAGGLFLYIENGFSVTANNKITFTVGDADTNIVMKKFDLGGQITIKRPEGKKGKFNLYISEEFNFNYGFIKFEGQEDRDAKAVNLYYGGTKKLTLGSDVAIPGLLHIKQSELELGGGSRSSGSIISGGSKITITGGTNIVTDMIYAPNATVNFVNGTVTGCIISKFLYMDGGATLNYKPLDTEFEEWTGGSAGKTSYKMGNWY